MRKQTTFLAVIGALAVAALACNLPSQREPVTATPTVTPPGGEEELTATPEPTEAPTDVPPTPTAEGTGEAEPSPTPSDGGSAPPPSEAPGHGEAIYETDFRTTWQDLAIPDEENPKGLSRVTGEGYQFEVVKNWGHWVFTARVDASTFYAEIEARPIDCPPSDSGYGLMFHHEDNENLRALVITCNGKYMLTERSGPTGTTLATGDLPEGTDPATGEHTVAVLAEGSTLTLYADGVKLDEVEVSDMPEGDVGPYAKTFDEPISVIFTRLAVYETE